MKTLFELIQEDLKYKKILSSAKEQEQEAINNLVKDFATEMEEKFLLPLKNLLKDDQIKKQLQLELVKLKDKK